MRPGLRAIIPAVAGGLALTLALTGGASPRLPHASADIPIYTATEIPVYTASPITPVPARTATPGPAPSTPSVPLRIWSDRGGYHPGDTVKFCYDVPGPGAVRITDISPDGAEQTVVEQDDDGSGDCFAGTIIPPAGDECLRLEFSGAAGDGTARSCWQVLADGDSAPADAATPSVSVWKTPGLQQGIGVITNIAGTGFDAWAGRSLLFRVYDASGNEVVNRKVGVLVDGSLTTTVGDATLPVGDYTFTFAALDDPDTVLAGDAFSVHGCNFAWNLDVPCRVP